MNIINVISSRPSLLQSLVKALRISVNMNAPIEFIRGSEQIYGSINFPLVRPGRNHTVLYYLSSDGPPKEYPPKPLRGEDKWDSDHVRLPCSNESQYPVENPQPGYLKVDNRWHMIQLALKSPIRDSKQFAEAILSYNHNYRSTWQFACLHALFENLDEDEAEKFFVLTLPAIADLALALPDLIKSPIPLLKRDRNRSLSLSQQQIACLLANAFFCTFPRRNSGSQKEYASYPYINFTSLYESEPDQATMEKLKCLIHYFTVVTQRTPRGVVTFSRRAVPPSSCPQWEWSETRLSLVPLHVDPDGIIEKADGLIQLDFANKYLGGGVLGRGCVQEEIRFVTCPELMASMLFTQSLTDTEALVIIGAERYSEYLGYGNTFEWANGYQDKAPMDHSGRKCVAVLAIDALPFRNFADQYKKRNIDRELNKAWVGFSAYSADGRDNLNFPGVATGNWGCGAFRGSPPLKSLIQLMACAEARRPMAYYTFKDNKFRDELLDIYGRLCSHEVTVGQLYKYILRFASSVIAHSHLFEYLRQVLQDTSHSSPAHGPEATTSRDPAEQATLLHQENSLVRSESPHPFSEDEDPSPETDRPSNQETKNQANIETRHEKMSSDTKITDSHIIQTDSDLKMSEDNNLLHESSTKMSDSHIRLLETSTSLVDSGTKLPDRSTKMSDSDIRNFVNHIKMPNKKCDDVQTPKNEVKITIEDSEHESKNTANNASLNHTLSLFEELQRFDDENGKLNMSVRNTSSVARNKRNIAVLNDSDVSIECDETVAPPEPKKKILSSKITDYFKKHPI